MSAASVQRLRGDESIELVGADGTHTTLATGQNGETGLAWSPSGDELFFTIVKGGSTEIRAVAPSGQQRLITEIGGEWTLQDVSREGRVVGFDTLSALRQGQPDRAPAVRGGPIGRDAELHRPFRVEHVQVRFAIFKDALHQLVYLSLERVMADVG